MTIPYYFASTPSSMRGGSLEAVRDGQVDQGEAREFEKFVAAAMKVDPKGLSGKHRKDAPPDEADEPPAD
ncbi:MAG TPA: hypothetical protein VHB02_00135 [Acidimicrobiales bacterium]|nr:hypothetical protein [Acidimicrobiales bacterium]